MNLDELMKLKDLNTKEEFEAAEEWVDKVVGEELHRIIKSRDDMKVINAALSMGMTVGNLGKKFNGEHGLDTFNYMVLLVVYGIHPLRIMLGEDYASILSYLLSEINDSYVVMDFILSMFNQLLVESNKLDYEKKGKLYTEFASRMLQNMGK